MPPSFPIVLPDAPIRSPTRGQDGAHKRSQRCSPPIRPPRGTGGHVLPGGGRGGAFPSGAVSAGWNPAGGATRTPAKRRSDLGKRDKLRRYGYRARGLRGLFLSPRCSWTSPLSVQCLPTAGRVSASVEPPQPVAGKWQPPLRNAAASEGRNIAKYKAKNATIRSPRRGPR